MKAEATQSFTQDRGTSASPSADAKPGATQATFTTSDAIPWKPVDPKNHPGLEMFAVWGNPNEGRLVDPAKVSRWHGLGLALAHRGVSGRRDPGQVHAYLRGSRTADRRPGIGLVATCETGP
jgi:hypothetical protein